MTASPRSIDRFRAVLVMLATVAMIAVNYLAAAGSINASTPDEVSLRYPTIITPANYAFSVWALIYAGLLAFSAYQLLPRNIEKYRQIRITYLGSCVLNAAWIYFWHYDRVAVCFGIILLLCACLFLINRFLRTSKSASEYWLVNGPFGIYFGWITAAMLVNFAVLLVSWKFPISPSTWTVVGVTLVLFAGILGIVMRIRLANYFYPLAIAWALTAIAVNQGANTPIVLAAAISVVGCLIATLSFVLKLPDSSSRVSINEQR